MLKLHSDALESTVLEEMDSHDLACTLKQFLMELPTPLITPELHRRFLALSSIGDEVRLRDDYLRCLVKSLPVPHTAVLVYVCNMLATCARHAEGTRMDVTNVGIVFAPVFMRSAESDMLSDALKCSEVVSLLVQKVNLLHDLVRTLKCMLPLC